MPHYKPLKSLRVLSGNAFRQGASPGASATFAPLPFSLNPMTLREQIITEIFQHERPECPKNILRVYYRFRVMLIWSDFRNLLTEYRFEGLPKHLITLEKNSIK